MSAALAYLDDDLQMPRRARHLYLVAVDGCIIAADGNRRRAACVRAGTPALPPNILDRSINTTLPDGTATSIAYGFGTDRDGQRTFLTTVTDANHNRKQSYRDVRELITAVQEFNPKGNQPSLWTSYHYDALKQITDVIDAKNNITRVTYDQLGHRTSLDNPDTGRTQTVYDPASNVTHKITANLAAVNQSIQYDYDYNRLGAIRYPQIKHNDVIYQYGTAAQRGNGLNQVGRIVHVDDAAGFEERSYGKLGETVSETRTLKLRDPDGTTRHHVLTYHTSSDAD